MTATQSFSRELESLPLLKNGGLEKSNGKYKVGDILKRRIDPLGIMNHYGVFVGVQNGVGLVFDIKKKGAIDKRALYQVATLQAFEKGRRSRVACPFSPDGNHEPVLQRIHDLVQQGEMTFDTLARDGWNCQQVAYWVVTERPFSPEAEAFHKAKAKGIKLFMGALIGFIASYVSERKRGENIARGETGYQEEYKK